MKDFLIYMVQSSVCLSIFGLVYLLFLRRQTFFKFNRIFLLAGVILSLFIPSIEFTYDVLVAAPSTSFDWTKLSVHEGVVEQKTAIDLWSVLAIAYLSGICILAIRHIGMFIKLKRLKRSGKRSTIGNYHLIDNKSIKTPFSMLNGIFINSEKLQAKEKELILKHEISHIQQKHWLDLLCSECALLLQWFNPLVWYYIHLQKENHEYLADQAVLQNGESTAVYRAVLINQRFRGPVFSFTNSFNYSNPQNRLNMMKKMKTSPWKKIAILAVLPLFGVFFALSAKPNYVMQEIVKPAIVKDSTITSGISVIGHKGELSMHSVGKDGSNPLIVIDGKETAMTAKELSEMDPTTIESVSVLKDQSAIDKYGEKGKDGVIEIETKKAGSNITVRGYKGNTVVMEVSPLIVIDGKETTMTTKELSEMDPATIESVSVLKDQSAIDKYGEKGKDGVIEIETKKPTSLKSDEETKPQLSDEEIAQINIDAQKVMADLDIDAIIKEVNESVKAVGDIKIINLQDLSQLQGLQKLQSLEKLNVLKDLSALAKLRKSDITPATKKSLQALEKLNALKDLDKLYIPE